MSKIIRLSAMNYKRLKAVEIEPDPDGNLVVVAGRNAQGKSSVLDSITAALGGVNKKTTPKPIRDGEDNAEIVLETEDLIVTRRFTKAGSTLTVSTPDGAKFPKGQAKLDDLIGKLSLDPFAFTMMDDKKQLETLLGLVDLPFDPQELEQQRKELYDQRAEIGRQGKAIGEVEVDESLPTEEQSAGELIAQIREAHDHNAELDNAMQAVEVQRVAVSTSEAEIERLEEQLKDARAQLEIDQSNHRLAQEKAAGMGGKRGTSDLEAQLATIEETNAKIRANVNAIASRDLQNKLRAEYQEYTDKINVLDETKSHGLANAKMPVDGLGFEADGVTYNGQPFRQASSAEQLRVSLAMAIALNPKMRVIRITDGSLLDDDNLQLIREMADEHDAQVWLEIVGEGDGTGIVIEDGEVANA
ncbi:MAG: AAA family ATPase [Micrococcaceae bacterium]|nr:AAA family ATPase [Micrococcaceae bacterium]